MFVENRSSNDFGAVNDPICALPDELALEIFSHLNLSSLGTICRVSKNWKQLSAEPTLWKIAIYREIAFGNDKWAGCFGKDIVKDEDRREEMSSFPFREFIEDCQKFKSIFPEKNAKEILMIVRLPKTLNGALTLKSLGELAKKYFSDSETGYENIWSGIVNELGDKSIDKSHWIIMTKDLLPGSKKQSYEKQQQIVADLAKKSIIGYEVPKTLESATCILSQYFFDSTTRLFSDVPLKCTRCGDKIRGYQTRVGNFTQKGLNVGVQCFDLSEVGVAVSKKFLS